MKNICITKSNSKFNNNLTYCNDEDVNVFLIDTTRGVYKSFYALQKDIHVLIVNLSLINNEILSFINDFKNQMRIIIYIDIDNTIPEALLNHQCEYLTHKDINLPKQIILPEFLVNKHLYENIDNTNIDKKDQFVFFLDNKTNIPDQLQKLLYPHTKLPIKLFNGSSIQHYQHLGYLNEADRKSVLLDSKVFIYDDTQYIIEAMLCKCSLIDLQTINKCENLQDIQSNIIDTYSYDHYKYYEEFIKEL